MRATTFPATAPTRTEEEVAVTAMVEEVAEATEVEAAARSAMTSGMETASTVTHADSHTVAAAGVRATYF